MEDPREKEAKEFLTEVAQLDEALKVLDSSLSQIKWRLRYARRRLEIDILALCTGMRPVIMVDYGGKMPELQERLCTLLKLCQKESPIFEHLRVMVIEEMIYLVHIRGLANHVRSSLNSERQLLFVDLEQDPPEMITEAEKSPLGMQLVSIQKWFSSFFRLVGRKDEPSSSHIIDNTVHAKLCRNELIPSESSDFIDLSICMENTQVLLPTLNGWLLGYPVVYLFSKEHSADAVYNLSTKYLHIYKISICRNEGPNKVSQVEELLSFSVPYDLSMGGSKEKWAGAYLAHMQGKWERCKHAWRSLQMEIYYQDNVYYTNLLYGRSDPRDTYPAHGSMLADEQSNESLILSKDAAQIDSATKRAQRTRNFSTEEDNLLVSSWLNVSSDASEGKKEKNGAYWNRMWEYFHEEKKFNSQRSPNSLMHRWSALQLAVRKFCGYYAEIKEVQESAVDEKDRAMEMYQQKQGHAFQYLQCWHVLKDSKKWMECSKKKSKISKIASPSTSPSTPDSASLREDDIASDISISLERPGGIMAMENTSDADPNNTVLMHDYMPVDKSSIEALVSSQIPAQIESTQVEQRSSNFSVDEDNLLVSCWLNVSLDADNGDKPANGAYWRRIWECFHKEKKFAFERTADSVMDRCLAIQYAVNNFCGYSAPVKAMEQGGVNEQDRILQAIEMYQKMQGHAFHFLHCWQVMKRNKIWVVNSSKKKPKYSENASPANSSPTPESISLKEDNVASDTSISLESPLGRMVANNLFRKEKDTDCIQGNSTMPTSFALEEFMTEKKGMERQRDENFRLRYSQDRELISIKREKLHSEQLKEEERIMLIDTTGLPKLQAEYYKIRQMEIMARKVGSN